MKKSIFKLFLIVIPLLFVGCFEDIDDNPASVKDINDFVWRGLNYYYLYKDEVNDLQNDRFINEVEYNAFLNSFNSPEALFNHLRYEPETIDKFSWITNDYIALEAFLNGTTQNNGMDFGLVERQTGASDIFGYVGYVLPNSSAANQGVQRGDIFYAINGTPLNRGNYQSLLSGNTYTINLGTYDDNGTPEPSDDSITPNGQSITLTKSPYTENPIFKRDVFNVAGRNVGYLVYNGFTRDFDSQLNDTFGYFLGNNVQDLVLDLRYNPGGSVNTAILLSSMIAGRNGEVFNTEEWNSDIQAQLSPESTTNRFTNNDDGTPLNILNLNRVYILTTKRSASASELVINCLRPYLDVVQIGTSTTGKYQASITLYDSPDFRRSGANPSHLYAMQPLVLKSVNVAGVTDYFNGLDPDILVSENYANMGALGDENELLLSVALQHIEDNSRIASQTFEPLKIIGSKSDFTPLQDNMYVEK
ncbi:carboxyl-terminal protease [Hanstruepera neustonica]|uniref:Carboxyl-terminal protease n=1 Tax=Hanstruepera neustonica TaxID=1445657 RepID=A0A2K1DWL3_9FLAO|nr:S41 family peptidase [Hanstruepera neustonica]PNQ72426.1 carboxyl-terminal protease [Hanstruepera neustonica]